MPVPRHYFKYAESTQEREALEALSAPERYPLLAPLGRLDLLVCQIGIFPTFSAYSTWSLVHKQGGYFVRRVVWNRAASTIPPAAPALYGSEARLPFESAQLLASELATLSLPLHYLIERQGLGLDGTTHSLTVPRVHSELALSWWEDGPPGWEALSQWHARARDLFETHLPPTSN